MISNLVVELPCAKVFASSRKESDIANTFSQIKAPTVEIEVRNTADDIVEIYLCGQVESLISKGDLVLKDHSLQGIIAKS